MQQVLTRKQQHLLKILNHKITSLSKFMQTEGLSQNDIDTFFIQCVFQASINPPQRNKKLSQQFNSQTEEQSNSQISDKFIENLEAILQKTITKRLQSGQKLEKILIQYAQKCCMEQQKLKNYLLSEEQNQKRFQENKKSSFNFETIRERIKQKKYINKIQPQLNLVDQPLIPPYEPSLTRICSIGDTYEPITPRKKIDETQKSLQQMRSFERSLAQSIRKTKLLRAMLENQLSSEFSSLKFNIDTQRIRDQEIY